MIYYFYDEDDNPDEDDWMLYNMVISLDGKKPERGDRVLVFNHETGFNKVLKVQPFTTVMEFESTYPSNLMKAAINSIFEAKNL